MTEGQPDNTARLQDAAAALTRGDAAGARETLQYLVAGPAESADAWLLLSRVEQFDVQFDAMLAAAERALALSPARWDLRFRHLECLLYCGRADAVRARLAEYEAESPGHAVLARLAEFHAHCLDHAAARRCLDGALAQAPHNADYLFSRAASEIALGELDAAEATLDRVIAIRPDDSDAWRNRSTLRRQLPDDNHVDSIRERLAAGPLRPASEAQLCYALAKELEDLQAYEASFEALARGASARRRILGYQVEHDLEVMQALQESFDHDTLSRARPGFEQRGPLFVLGLPRSGTTLVERILGSHSQVDSLGEVNDFAFSLMHTLGQRGSKTELVRAATTIDPRKLGERYWLGMTRYGHAGPLLIDKTPLNYLYLGLLRMALPAARVIHVRRAPMDSCYGMYRTLFRAGYPFSYDLDDLARYYIGWHGLMKHWREVLGDWYLELEYERLVDDQAGETRRLLEFCGLDWEESCLQFHENPAAVATASAAQVRRPVYRDALQRWRRYERQLRPLEERLQAAGIETR